MKAERKMASFFSALGRRSRPKAGSTCGMAPPAQSKIGLALGGGFARGIAHAGVLEVFERHQIPIHCITGVSAGSIVAAAYASGASAAEIAQAGSTMRFGDVARWSLGRTGLVASGRMTKFLEKVLKRYRFEEMCIPLGVIATDLSTGRPVCFQDSGDVILPIRASCSYPGLFQPVRYEGQHLVDGAISVDIPARLARQLGATHVISVHLPPPGSAPSPANIFQVVNRCIQILQSHTEEAWRKESDLVITPDVNTIPWDGFHCGPDLLKAGRAAAMAALPEIQSWLPRPEPELAIGAALLADASPV